MFNNKAIITKGFSKVGFYVLVSVFLSACAATSSNDNTAQSSSSNNGTNSILGSLIAGAVSSAVSNGSTSSGIDSSEGSSNGWLVPLVVGGVKAAYDDSRKNKPDVTKTYFPNTDKKTKNELIVISSKGVGLPNDLNGSVKETYTLKNIPISLALLDTSKISTNQSDINLLKQKYPQLLIQPNYYYYLDGKESRAVKPYPQYALKMLGFESDKARMQGGKGTRIGIIDTPVDTGHPSLKGASISQVNLLKNKKAGRLHATVIAGILVGRDRLQGVVPRAMITSVGAFEERQNSGSSGKSTSFLLAKAFDRIISARVNVLNLSFGSTERDELMQRLVSETLKRNIKIVASVGNDGNQIAVRYPAAYNGVYGITALDSQSRLYNRANTGNTVDYALPGVNIISSKPGGRYTSITGTSFANAYAAGLIALQLSKNKNLNQLSKATQDLGSKGKDSRFGYGLLKSH